MLIAINFHYVRPSFDLPYPGIHGITPVQFEAQLTALARVGTFVSGDDVLAAVQNERPLPDRSLLVTFDDGLREQFDHAWPVLVRLGIQAMFFINTCPIVEGSVSMVHKIHLLRASMPPERFLEMFQAHARRRGIPLCEDGMDSRATEHYRYDSPQVARLKYLLNVALPQDQAELIVADMFDEYFAGQEADISSRLYMDRQQVSMLGRHRSIGTHAHRHLPLGVLSDARIDDELRLSADHIEDLAGYRPFALSYPYGTREASTAEAAEVAKRYGVRFAFTMERAANRQLGDPLHLARFDNNDMPGGKAAICGADDLFYRVPARQWYCRTPAAPAEKN